MSRQIQSGTSFPERMEKHEKQTWHDLSFNHKTTLTMGLLVPLATKEVYPGEIVKLQTEIMMRFAPLILPIMHQCYFTLDWYYVNNRQLFLDGGYTRWDQFIRQDPINPTVVWAWTVYTRAKAVFTDGVLNYMGFNAPPGSGTLITSTVVGAMPLGVYLKIYDRFYRNDQIQTPKWFGLNSGDNTAAFDLNFPDFRAFRRNWPRDYYTSATPLPQQGANVLIPSFGTDPEDGSLLPQRLFKLDGTSAGGTQLGGEVIAGQSILYGIDALSPVVLQLSSTVRDLTYARHMTEYLERSMRAGDRYSDFVKRNFDWDPDPLCIDQPVWIGGYSGNVVISEVMATAEVGNYTVGGYAGQAMVRDNSPLFTYRVPDYGFVMSIMTVYPKASYYSGLDNMWRRVTKMDYMWEQFALIGDQPIRNKEVWFSWYDADIAWNDEIFGYLPQYTQWRYSNDIVSGQMRTLWESFHLGRKFEAAGDVVLNSDFITCTPDVGRVFVIDEEAGEHEIYVHAYNKIEILRRLPKFGLPEH